MSPRTFMVAILALVCGVSASVGVNHMRKGLAQAKPDVVVVPVAAVNIKRGEEVTEAKLVGREWPKAMVPAGAILKKADIVGNIAQVPIVKNEPIFSGKIGDSPRFSGLIKEGMRAYTIATPSDSSLVAGLVEPGDTVDILFTGRTNRATTGGASTVPLLQNIEVMAKGQLTDASEKGGGSSRRMRSVTLLVPLEMASLLALSQRVGTLHLALRSDKDQATADVSAVTLTQLLRTAYPALFGDETEAAEDAKAKQDSSESNRATQFAVRTIRGSVRSTMLMRTSGSPIGSMYAVQSGPIEPEEASPLPGLPYEMPWLGGDEGSTQ